MTIKYLDSKRISTVADSATSVQGYSTLSAGTNGWSVGTGAADGTLLSLQVVNGSALIGDPIQNIKVTLYKNSSPDQLAYVRVRNSSNVILAEASKQASTLTGSATEYVFTLNTGVILSALDRVNVEYYGASGTGTVGIEVLNNAGTSTVNCQRDTSTVGVYADIARRPSWQFDSSPSTTISILQSKPTNVQDNSILVEKDTGIRYWFSEASDGADNITWSTTGKVGFNISGTTISRTGSSGWGTGKIQSEDTFTVGNGTFMIEFSGNNGSTMLGFNKGTLGYYIGSPENKNDFSIYLAGGSTVEVYESGSKNYDSGGSRNANDKFRIEIDNAGLVKYYLQAGGTGSFVLKYTSSTTASGTYFIQVNAYANTSESTVHSKYLATPAKWNKSLGGFALIYGGGGSSTEKFSWATKTTAGGTALAQNYEGASALCNGAVAGFFAGGTGGSYISTVFKYNYSDSAITTKSATTSAIHSWGGSWSTATIGYVVRGNNNGGYGNTVEKYNYAGDSMSSGTSLNNGSSETTTHQTSTVGFATGRWSGSSSGDTEKYTFSSDAKTTGTSLITATSKSGAGTNTATGLIAGGQTGNGTGYQSRIEKYDHSSDAVTVASGSLTVAGNASNNSYGNDEYALFVGVGTSTVALLNDYTYSTGTVTSPTALVTARNQHSSSTTSSNEVIE